MQNSSRQNCGACRFFQPTVNPKTGALLANLPGECTWKVPLEWPDREAWPDSFSRSRELKARPMQACEGRHCTTFERKEILQRQTTLILF